MKKISYQKMADTIIAKRKEKKLTQAQLADMTGIHRAMVSRLEGLDYIPSIDQLQAIAEARHCCKFRRTGRCTLLNQQSGRLYPVKYDRILQYT